MKKIVPSISLLIVLLFALFGVGAFGAWVISTSTPHTASVQPAHVLIVGLAHCPSGYAHATRLIYTSPDGMQTRYQDVCIIQGYLSLYCLLPSVESNYTELDIVLCVNTGKPATQDQIAQGYYADDCTSNPYIPCYTPCFSYDGKYPVPCPGDNAPASSLAGQQPAQGGRSVDFPA